MKITRMEILPADVGHVYVFVKLHTDEGIFGVGEPSVTGKERALIGALQDLEHFLIGQNPFAIERLWNQMYRTVIWRGGPVLMAALSGVEHALWDIKGKGLGVPVWELLGGRVRDRVEAYAWIHGGSPENCAEDALRRLEEGFRTVKFTPFDFTGLGYNVAEGKRAEARVRAVREAVGDEVGIAIDAHGVLNPVNAMEMAKRIEPYGILFYEEPVHPENTDAMAEIRRVARIPIATGERLFTRYAFKDLLVRNAVDVIQADVGNAGGILEVYKIAAMAEAFYASISPHNPWSPLTTAISLHLDAVVQNFLIQEIPTAGAPPDRSRLLQQQIEHPRDGHLEIPAGPGWGVDLDEEFIRSVLWDPSTPREPPWLPLRPDGGLVHT
ncbi:MAG: galactonate dehydratase [Gemmatimonadetes bacterium]|jgi:galactonate dehydratase|nr:galactonate dehydratase [Gemmatimonadota bacterium]